jgi:hypothetical protein
MTNTKLIDLLAIDDLLVQFSWLKDVEYVEVDTLSDPDIGTYMLEAELDDDGDMIDLVYTRCSYRTTLRSEPNFWAFENLRAGDYVISM